MAYNNVVYWSMTELQDSVPSNAQILAVGDSWFWYPMPGGSLLNYIGDLVKPKGYKILAVGNNGAEAYDYVDGKYKNVVKGMFKLYGSTAKALLISGGGNDFAGFNDLRRLLNDKCGNASTALECFKPGTIDDEGTVTWLMHKTFENYSLLISRALARMPADVKIFVHNYDYAMASGKGALGGEPWLKPALDDAKVPAELQRDCIRLLIDMQSDILERLQKALPNNIVYVDSRGTLADSDWANELHPSKSGFQKIANNAWKPLLAKADLA
ncbi:SGNH/GDSL hydrolase family protein [Comamonas sp. lk]|uniref:SGNH/GDSL hydrolase family protein n=1 Tax=Comamonas sp. lk TaxID=2201272 RepID=UPI0019693EA3|nr:SGNH/GDSL hydrolase family protein [Comamonas sp. lk]